MAGSAAKTSALTESAMNTVAEQTAFSIGIPHQMMQIFTTVPYRPRMTSTVQADQHVVLHLQHQHLPRELVELNFFLYEAKKLE